ncbi:hypothetical protein BASA61_009446, partial [Batrachochytrium salamandrivorans]
MAPLTWPSLLDISPPAACNISITTEAASKDICSPITTPTVIIVATSITSSIGATTKMGAAAVAASSTSTKTSGASRRFSLTMSKDALSCEEAVSAATKKDRLFGTSQSLVTSIVAVTAATAVVVAASRRFSPHLRLTSAPLSSSSSAWAWMWAAVATSTTAGVAAAALCSLYCLYDPEKLEDAARAVVRHYRRKRRRHAQQMHHKELQEQLRQEQQRCLLDQQASQLQQQQSLLHKEPLLHKGSLLHRESLMVQHGINDTTQSPLQLDSQCPSLALTLSSRSLSESDDDKANSHINTTSMMSCDGNNGAISAAPSCNSSSCASQNTSPVSPSEPSLALPMHYSISQPMSSSFSHSHTPLFMLKSDSMSSIPPLGSADGSRNALANFSTSSLPASSRVSSGIPARHSVSGDPS